MASKQSFYLYLLGFLLLNFTALLIGGLFTNQGVTAEWYSNLNKAPWTPPGWVFGAAWTLIMICLAIYMSIAMGKVEHKTTLWLLFGLQWILNIGWNPVFFHYQQVVGGLIIISALTLLLFFFFVQFWSVMAKASLLLAPYLIWLLIATSLNAYILVKN